MSTQPPVASQGFLDRIKQQDAVEFPHGIPGFPAERKFVLLQNPDEKPFIWMQSLQRKDLAFVVTSPFVLFPEYRPDVPSEDLEALENPTESELLVLTIVSIISTKPPLIHANLKAPLVINLKTHR
jgi:flagellar assembly factor FliW